MLAERIFDRWSYLLVYTASGIGRQPGQPVVASPEELGQERRAPSSASPVG